VLGVRCMKYFKNIYLLLFLIVLLAAVLRFYGLSANPPSLTWDEAAWGYNAYSLGIDGKDEFGRFLPITYLESFGDFKPPVYAYLGILPVKVFGLNEFATRFPSAFLGTMTVLVTYFLVKELFGFQKVSKVSEVSKANDEIIALVSAFVLAISPWHIMLSRAAFEANVATFFIVTGVWLFLYSINHKPWFLLLSAISFVLSMYTFNTARIVVPLLIVGLVIGTSKQLLKIKKQTVATAIFGFFILLPLIPFLFSPQARLRFQEVNIFSDISVVEKSNQAIKNDHNVWWSKIIHNRRIGYTISFMNHYLDHFTPNFLFIKGDGNPKFSTRSVGQMYLWEIPFLVIGTFMLFKKRKGYWWIIPYWLLIGIIPAATARETPHALRIEAVLPTFQILVGYGIYYVISNFKFLISNFKLRQGIVLFLGVVIVFNLIYFLHGYFVHYPYEFSGEWQYGYREAIHYVKSVEESYDEVRMTTDLGRPYVYYLFYTETQPEEFRRTAIVRKSPFGFVDIDGFGKYRFAEDVSADTSNKRILYIDSAGKVPGDVHVLKTIHLLNGKEALKVYTL
jgi:4-amino-4-deoxy-L-arabinose transferase-like glycosyltransferase